MHFSTLITHLNDIYYNLVHTTNEKSARSATKWFLNRFSKLIDLYDQIVSNKDYSDRIKIEVEVFFHSLRKLLIELETSFEERCLDGDIIDKVINLNCLDERNVKYLKQEIKKYKAGKMNSKCEGSQLSIDFKIRSVDLEMIYYKKLTKKILNIYSHSDKKEKEKKSGFK
ncbi:hypothetical protein TUBRATIS_25360 [Tubulinosema ratisbonensis]|uniref:Uncharacterized protein n=1 Tax=Tubulinosema ratisbonensis TaxID=291195 RepID=A0A437AIY5_9MICR|nr:hypothetical protein TUBRATIS_25360 [Tubulinosema ratisbonensis]